MCNLWRIWLVIARYFWYLVGSETEVSLRRSGENVCGESKILCEGFEPFELKVSSYRRTKSRCHFSFILATIIKRSFYVIWWTEVSRKYQEPGSNSSRDRVTMCALWSYCFSCLCYSLAEKLLCVCLTEFVLHICRIERNPDEPTRWKNFIEFMRSYCTGVDRWHGW